VSGSFRALALLLALTAALGACRSVDIVATRVQGGAVAGDAAADANGSADADTGQDAAADAGQNAAVLECDERGPRLRVGDNSLADTVCTTGTPARAFAHAICVCEDYAALSSLLTDAVDSSSAGFPAAMAGGSVGVNGTVGNNGFYIHVGGSLTVASPFGVTIAPSVSPAADLQVDGNLVIGGGLQGTECGVAIGGDARVDGRVTLQDLEVGGQLVVPEGFEIDVNGVEQIGSLVREPVQVQQPCGCEQSDLVDIAAKVSARANDNQNDNELLDFEVEELNGYQGSLKLNLPCGRFYLPTLTGQGSLELVVSGRAALYVRDLANLEGPFTVRLEPGAELDLFFANSLVAADTLELGSRDAPERVRLYIGAGGTVDLGGQSLVAGHLYAPGAELVNRDQLEVFGSVFVKRVSGSGRLTVHQDLNPLEAGQPCR
jgi:hypothetical protein